MNSSKKHVVFLISAALVTATLVAYEPIRHNGFVSFDDTSYIVENTQVKSGITWESIGQAFTKPHFSMWHPLTTINHMLDYQLFGLNPLGHHLVSVLIHIANALLLFWIVNRLTGTIWASAFVAGVFALHPIQVESVAWAAERKTVLSGLFWLLTMAAYIHYSKQPRLSRYLLVLLVFGLCIMTKPVVATLPFVLLLLDYWPLDRVRWAHQSKNTKPAESNQKSIGWLIAEKIPLLAMSAFLSVMTYISQETGGIVRTLAKMPLDYRIANMFLSYIRYIGKMIWPSGLAAYYPHPRGTFPATTVVICALLFILTSVLCIYTARRRRYIAVGWLWYVGTLVPVIGLTQSGTQAMANRYMYIPILGLLIIVGMLGKDLLVKRPRLRSIAAISAIAVLLTGVILTRMQTRHWQNSMTLFEYALKVTKNNELAENSYGCALFEAGQINEALLHINKALQINPAYLDARNNLGQIYLKQGKLNEAIVCFKRVLDGSGATSQVYSNLALALGIQKKYDEAMKYLIKAMELEPNNPDIHNKMGMALLSTGRGGEAITHFKYVLQTNTIPAEAYANLGSAYIQMDNYESAIENLTKAIELKPNNIGALNNLAWALVTVNDISKRDANRAIEYARRACELTGDKEAGLLDTLAVAYAAGGRFEEAKATAEKALSIAKSSGRKDLASEIEKRIKLYEAGQPYRQK
jgi:protein O-mannosyl-transferase